MRQLGKVKWFGGYNSQTNSLQNFGFITPKSGEADLYVHRRQLINTDDLTEGMAVSFKASINPQTGKMEAREVQQFDSTSDPDLIEECINSNDPLYWRPVFKKYIATLAPSEAATLACNKLATLKIGSEIVSLISTLPDAVLLSSLSLREMLSPDKRLRILIEGMVTHECIDPYKEPIHAEIKFCLTTFGRDSSFWENVPRPILELPDIWPIVPHSQKVRVIREEINSCKISTSNFDTIWENLSKSAKILILFRYIKERREFPYKITNEQDEVVDAVLQLCKKASSAQPDLLFQSFHVTLQDYVINQAWSSSESLNFFPLLPDCLSMKASKVQYCEARAWPTDEDRKIGAERVSRAFCPRLDRDCILFEPGAKLIYGNQGARLYPEWGQEWFDWSLLEVFDALKIVPKLPELRNPGEYIQKLSGWINRLNEIREKLKCSFCNEIMPPNYKYAKNLARYNTTVVSCEHGIGHDKNIYLNHCWGCEKVIDSRESKIRVQGYYICIYCGSGPQTSRTYKQGSICPKCGTPDMQIEQQEKVYYTDADSDNSSVKTRICLNPKCSHTIRLPAVRKRTGIQQIDYENFSE